MLERHGLQEAGIPVQQFVERYHHHNERYWSLYRQGRISQHTLRLGRWQHTLRDFGLDENAAPALSEEYLDLLPAQTGLMAHAREVLHYLQGRYALHILTNGFDAVQRRKLEASELQPFFHQVITAEQAGSRKPDPAIFHYAFSLTGARADDSLLVGDSWEADALGAQAVGMDYVLIAPSGAASLPANARVIFGLKELIHRL